MFVKWHKSASCRQISNFKVWSRVFCWSTLLTKTRCWNTSDRADEGVWLVGTLSSHIGLFSYLLSFLSDIFLLQWNDETIFYVKVQRGDCAFPCVWVDSTETKEMRWWGMELLCCSRRRRRRREFRRWERKRQKKNNRLIYNGAKMTSCRQTDRERLSSNKPQSDWWSWAEIFINQRQSQGNAEKHKRKRHRDVSLPGLTQIKKEIKTQDYNPSQIITIINYNRRTPASRVTSLLLIGQTIITWVSSVSDVNLCSGWSQLRPLHHSCQAVVR